MSEKVLPEGQMHCPLCNVKLPTAFFQGLKGHNQQKTCPTCSSNLCFKLTPDRENPWSGIAVIAAMAMQQSRSESARAVDYALPHGSRAALQGNRGRS